MNSENSLKSDTFMPACVFLKNGWVYIGSYAHARNKGIYVSRWDSNTGSLRELRLAAETVNPSFLAFHPRHSVVYAVGEIAQYRGQPSGFVASFSQDVETGKLTLINRVSSHGKSPCHLSVDHEGQVLLAANYGGGNVSLFPLKPDGHLSECSSILESKDASLPGSQQSSHPHQVTFSPDNRFFLIPDLGQDTLTIYRLTGAAREPSTEAVARYGFKPGSGPRNGAFHPNGGFIYVVCEKTSTLEVFSVDAAMGNGRHIQSIVTFPRGFKGSNTGAALVVHPNGRFLYVSNRGHDSLAVFMIDAGSGRLEAAGHWDSGGRCPRHFSLDDSGNFLLAANQNSDQVSVFRIQPDSGALSLSGTWNLHDNLLSDPAVI